MFLCCLRESHPSDRAKVHRGILVLRSQWQPGQENSAFDICMDAFNCVRLRLREFNLHVFVYLSMRLDALLSNS